MSEKGEKRSDYAMLAERLERRNAEVLELKREKWKLEGEVLAMAQTLRDIANPPEQTSDNYAQERAKAMMFIMEPRIGVSNKSLTAALWGPAPQGDFK